MWKHFLQNEGGIFLIRSKSSMNGNQKLFDLNIFYIIKQVTDRREGGSVLKSCRLSVSGQKQAEEEDIILVWPRSSYPKWIDSMANQKSIILLSPPPAIKILIPLENIQSQKQIKAAIKKIKKYAIAKQKEDLKEEARKDSKAKSKDQEVLK